MVSVAITRPDHLPLTRIISLDSARAVNDESAMSRVVGAWSAIGSLRTPIASTSRILFSDLAVYNSSAAVSKDVKFENSGPLGFPALAYSVGFAYAKVNSHCPPTTGRASSSGT